MTALDGLRDCWEAVPKERPAVLWLKDGLALLCGLAAVPPLVFVLWVAMGAP